MTNDYLDHTCEFKQCCHVENIAQQCSLGLFQDSDVAGDLLLCIFGSHTFEPISWMSKKQTSHWCRCDRTFSREGRFLHFPESSETVSSAFVWLKNSLQYLSHHTATSMATSARKQAPLHLERTRVSLFSSSFSCAMIAWLTGHWAEAAGYLTPNPNLLSLRPCSVSQHQLSVLKLRRFW